MHERSLLSVGAWLLIGLVLWVIAWIIAEAIPVFSDLLSLITALFASWFTCEHHHLKLFKKKKKKGLLTIMIYADGLSGIFWLFLNWGKYFSSPRKIILTLINLTVVGIGGALVCLFSRIYIYI